MDRLGGPAGVGPALTGSSALRGHGLRHLVHGGDPGGVGRDVAVPTGHPAPGLACSTLAAYERRARTPSRLKPELVLAPARRARHAPRRPSRSWSASAGRLPADVEVGTAAALFGTLLVIALDRQVLQPERSRAEVRESVLVLVRGLRPAAGE